MTLQDWAAVVTSGCTLITAVFVGWQVRKMAESLSLSRDQNQHVLCLEVWREYNKTFDDRQKLLERPAELTALQRAYPSVTDLINSEEYKTLKRVAGVYVLAGALVSAGAIRRDVIYQYISVPTELWTAHWPLVKHLRDVYYPDLWRDWEQLVTAPENKWLK